MTIKPTMSETVYCVKVKILTSLRTAFWVSFSDQFPYVSHLFQQKTSKTQYSGTSNSLPSNPSTSFLSGCGSAPKRLLGFRGVDRDGSIWVRFHKQRFKSGYTKSLILVQSRSRDIRGFTVSSRVSLVNPWLQLPFISFKILLQSQFPFGTLKKIRLLILFPSL